jgi:hypothetical protein
MNDMRICVLHSDFYCGRKREWFREKQLKKRDISQPNLETSENENTHYYVNFMTPTEVETTNTGASR